MTHYKKSYLNALIMGMLSLCLLSLAGVSQARPLISEQEQASLQRILYELNASNEILLEAQRTADKQDRFRFAYHCLVTDINLVKKGLYTAINGIKNRAFQNQELCIEYGYAGSFGSENALLQQYINELQSILPIVQSASSYANQQYQARFNYSVLSSDIKTIIMGIERSLIGSGEQLRKFPVMRGKFSQ